MERTWPASSTSPSLCGSGSPISFMLPGIKYCGLWNCIIFLSRVFNMLFSMLRPFLSDSVRDNVVFHSGDVSTIRNYIRLYLGIPIDHPHSSHFSAEIFFPLTWEAMGRWGPWTTSTMSRSSGRWIPSFKTLNNLVISELYDYLYF